MWIHVYIRIILISVCSGIIQNNCENKIELIIKIVDNIAEHFINPLCTRVYLSDSKVVNIGPIDHISAVGNIQPLNPDAENVTIDVRFKHKPWPYRLAQSVGNCVLFVVVSNNDFDRVLDEGAKLFQMDIQNHYFIIYCTAGVNCESQDGVMYSKKLNGLKYKIFISSEDGKSFKLSSVSFFKNKGYEETVQIGVSHEEKEIQWFYSHPFPDFTRNMNGATVKFVFMHDVGTETVRILREKKEIVDLVGRLSEILPRVLNAEVIIEATTVPLVDMQLDDGTWTGGVGEILLEKYNGTLITLATDIILDPIALTKIVFMEKVGFVIRIPRSPITWKALYQPFSPLAWLGVFLFSLFAAASLSLLLLAKFQKDMDDVVSYSFFLVFWSLLGMGPSSYPSSHSGRVFVAFWLFVALLFCTCYQSKLLAMMTFKTPESIPENLPELSASDFNFGCYELHCVYLEVLVQDDKREFIKQILRKAISKETIKICVETALVEDFACGSISMLLRYEAPQLLDMHGKETLDLYDKDGMIVYLTTAFQRDFVALALYNKFFTFILESGIAEKVDRDSVRDAFLKGLRDETRYTRGELEDTQPLALAQFKGHFGILIIGLLLGSIIFICETIRKKAGKLFI